MTIFINAISFEERCLALPSQVPLATKGDRFVVIDFQGYEDVAPYVFNRSRMLSMLESKGYEISRIDARVTCPLAAMEIISQMTRDSSGVVLDISALPRNYLFTTSRHFADLNIPIAFRYYRPLHYGSELSRGVRSLGAIPGFQGDMSSTGETVLIVILGFEGYKALYAWERIGPTSVWALLGDPPYEDEFLKTAMEKNSDLLEMERVKSGKLDTLDVLKARDQLQALYDAVRQELPNASFVVCPLGTKPQSLAAFSFAYMNPSVAVIYVSSAAYFHSEYSRGFRPEYTTITSTQLLRQTRTPSLAPLVGPSPYQQA